MTTRERPPAVRVTGTSSASSLAYHSLSPPGASVVSCSTTPMASSSDVKCSTEGLTLPSPCLNNSGSGYACRCGIVTPSLRHNMQVRPGSVLRAPDRNGDAWLVWRCGCGGVVRGGGRTCQRGQRRPMAAPSQLRRAWTFPRQPSTSRLAPCLSACTTAHGASRQHVPISEVV